MTSSIPTRSRPLKFVLAGGLAAGTLDITYACVFWGVRAGVPATRIFQSVAAGLLGKASFEGGAATAVLGLGLHFFIALSMSFTYYLVARRWPLLWRRPVPMGAAYGLLLYGIMTYIVVPLSAAGSGGVREECAVDHPQHPGTYAVDRRPHRALHPAGTGGAGAALTWAAAALLREDTARLEARAALPADMNLSRPE